MILSELNVITINEVEAFTIYINEDVGNFKEDLSISRCFAEPNNTFWLIHSKDRVTVHTQPAVNIDELNDDLDSLLNM